MRKVLLISGCILAAAPVSAEPIKGEADVGLVVTTGNSNTENLNGKLKLTTETEKWKHVANIGALSSSSENPTTEQDQTTAEKYFVNYKADRKLDERAYLYSLTGWEKDRFSGFKYQATTGVGYGYKLIAEEHRTLAFEIGPGYRYNAIDTTDSIAEEDDSEVTLRLGETYDWKFSDNAVFNQYLSIEGGADNTISRFGIGLKSQLNGSLSLKVGIDMKHTENPAKDASGKEFDDIDTESYATIGYSF